MSLFDTRVSEYLYNVYSDVPHFAESLRWQRSKISEFFESYSYSFIQCIENVVGLIFY